MAWSAGLHLAFTAFVILYTTFIHGFRSGEGWGSGGMGDAMGATLVASVPLPASAVQTNNVLATESKGLSKSQPKVQEQEPEAVAIPDKNSKAKPKPVTSATKRNPEPEQEETNQIPYGEGGPVSGPYSTFSAANAQGAIGVVGGTGDFGTRYAWYVKVIQQKVQENWMKYEVDPGIKDARRVYLTWEVTRDGSPKNVQIEQSSGVPSLDRSAVNALQRIDTFGPLPSDYSGSKISVEWYFDLNRK